MMSERPSLIEQEKKHWDALLAGEQSGLFELYQLFYKYLHDYGYQITHDVDLIKDCIQNLFLHIWDKRDNLSSANNVRYYLISSFRRSLFEVLQKEKKLQSIEGDNLENYNHISVEEEIIRNQDTQQQSLLLSKAIKSLPAKQQQYIYLKYYKGLDYEEIAKISNTSIRTVYNQTNLAIQSLRKNKSLKLDEQQLISLLLLSGLSQLYTN